MYSIASPPQPRDNDNAPSWLALRYLRWKPVGRFDYSSLCLSHPKCIHTVFPFFFALSRLSLPFLSFSASPGCVCQWHFVVLCGGPTSGTAVSHKSASSFNSYRQSLSLCLWICATYCLHLYFSISLHFPICESFCFPPLLMFAFHLHW